MQGDTTEKMTQTRGSLDMIYRVIALLVMVAFYGIYFTKKIVQKQRGIVTDQIAKSRERDKSYYIEMLMKIATHLVPVIEVISIIIGRSGLPIMGKIIGIYLGLIGDSVFLIAVITMRDSWRAGVAKEEKRDLVTEGIYRYSRNPAFLGFDLVYVGILLMFFQPVLLFSTLFAMVMFHLQILQEEAYLENTFSKEYTDYKSRVNRYVGCGKLTVTKALFYAYFLLFLWSIFYFCTCLIYGGGIRLSWVWLWILIAAFSGLRLWMLKNRLDGRERFRIPATFQWIYRIIFAICLLFFVLVEGKIIGAMNSTPSADLSYIVVLGAGLRGKQPSNPLRVRIDRAAAYMKENPDTMLIASGGKGKHEEISEAQCIKNTLIERYGVDENRIILEERSRDTEENLKNSLEIIGNEDASVGIVTNGFHELRAMTIAEHAGYQNAEPVPAITLMPVGIHYVVREFFGMAELYAKYGMMQVE